MHEMQPRAELTPGEAFDLLANDRRRAVVVAVAEAAEPLSTEELTTLVASKEDRLTPDRIDPRARRAIRSDLEGHQLPKLVEMDVLDSVSHRRYVAGANLEGVVAAADAAADHLV